MPEGAPVKLLKAKAAAISKAIRGMSDQDRKHLPSEVFGADYNGLRDMVIAAVPELNDLMPPPVEFGKMSNGTQVTSLRFAELNAFCEQIVQLLSDME